MRAYRWSVRLKLGLIVFAGAIALASLWYTQRLVDRLRDREQAVIQLWADAQAQVAQAQQRSINPYRDELRRLDDYLRDVETFGGPTGAPAPDIAAYRRAVRWAQSMPPTGVLNFILNEILEPDPFSIPAIITDSLRGDPLFWRNVNVPDTLSSLPQSDSVAAVERLRRLRREMDAAYEPIPIRIDVSSGPRGSDGSRGNDPTELTQFVHYDESRLVRELRIFPWIQLLFVGLFIGVGYVGFSYVRRSEQSNLWVGMAREAAHQLGTPISSLMGWVEVLRMPDLSDDQRAEAVEEIENDVDRLQRVANRFSDIGSMPKLDHQPLAPIIEQTAAYIQRRIPQRRERITLTAEVPDDLEAPVNEELFAWVVENLLKNALDAIDGVGRIELTAGTDAAGVWVEVEDTGAGIERSQWKNIFRPGYSTKKRGWGLGLSLARRVIEDYHGGSLRLVNSTVGEGSTFRIELPHDEDG